MAWAQADTTAHYTCNMDPVHALDLVPHLNSQPKQVCLSVCLTAFFSGSVSLPGLVSLPLCFICLSDNPSVPMTSSLPSAHSPLLVCANTHLFLHLIIHTVYLIIHSNPDTDFMTFAVILAKLKSNV